MNKKEVKKEELEAVSGGRPNRAYCDHCKKYVDPVEYYEHDGCSEKFIRKCPDCGNLV